MSLDSSLNASRRRVQNVLKDKMKRYLTLMGSWFKGKLSKEEFDSEARLLFTDDTVGVHNQFLLAMLNRCQSVGGALGTRDLNRTPSIMKSPPLPMQRQKPVKKKPYAKTNFTQRFQPANQLRQVQRLLSPPSSSGSKMTFASSDHGLLPHPGMIEGRLYVAAWETGLENVQSDIYTLISLAAEELLRNIVSHVVSCRRGYRVSQTERVKQYVGIDAPVVYLPPTWAADNTGESVLVKAQREEADSVQSLARTGPVVQGSVLLTARDMFTALMSNPDVIGSFTMYTLAMERLSARLYHRQLPDHVTANN